MFVREGRPGCNWRVADFQTLTSSPCDCEGFRPVMGTLAEAAFAATPEPDYDVPIFPLRVVEPKNYVQDGA